MPSPQGEFYYYTLEVYTYFTISTNRKSAYEEMFDFYLDNLESHAYQNFLLIDIANKTLYRQCILIKFKLKLVENGIVAVLKLKLRIIR